MCRQNRHNTCGISEVKCALVGVCLVGIVSLSCAVFLQISPAYISIGISSSCSVTPTSSSPYFCLTSSYHFSLSLSLPANSPVCLACWKSKRCVSLVCCVSATFQLASIPASGCVEDKMELIPPGYCYLCFPPCHTPTVVYLHTYSQIVPHEHTPGKCQGTGSQHYRCTAKIDAA